MAAVGLMQVDKAAVAIGVAVVVAVHKVVGVVDLVEYP